MIDVERAHDLYFVRNLTLSIGEDLSTHVDLLVDQFWLHTQFLEGFTRLFNQVSRYGLVSLLISCWRTDLSAQAFALFRSADGTYFSDPSKYVLTSFGWISPIDIHTMQVTIGYCESDGKPNVSSAISAILDPKENRGNWMRTFKVSYLTTS